MKLTRITIFICTITASLQPISDAQTLELLETSVVTAQRIQTSWLSSPFAIDQINPNYWQDTQARNLTETLQHLPSVMLQKTANGHGSPYIRGFTGYRTLALVDGIRYNHSVYRDGPNEYFSLLDLQSIDSIEVLKGPSSVLYGSDAIGGSLHLKTKSSDFMSETTSYTKGRLSYRLSTAEQSHQTSGTYEFGQGKKWGATLTLSGRKYGDLTAANLGVLPHTGYDEYAMHLRFDTKINDQWFFTATHQQLAQNDVWRTHSTIYSKSFAGTTIGSDLRRLKDQHRSLSYIKLTGEDLDYTFADEAQLTLSLQSWDENGERQRSDRSLQVEHLRTRMLGVDTQLTKTIGNLKVTYGSDLYQDNVDSNRTDYNSDGSFKRKRIQGPVGDDATYTQLGIYANARYQLTNLTELIVGSRFSSIHADIGRFEDPSTGDAASFSDHWNNLSSSIRIQHSLNEAKNTNVWTALSQSFRAPNIADLSRYGGSRSNEIESAATHLDPEHFLTFEIGIKTEQDRYRLSANYYYTDIHDYITSKETGRIIDSLTQVTKTNAASGFVHGIELEGIYQPSPQWILSANATWMNGKLDIGSGDEPLSRLMPLTLNANAKWVSADTKLQIGIQLQHAARADKLNARDQSDTQRIPPNGTPSYTKATLYSSYNITDDYILNLAIDNLFDTAYRTHGSGTNSPGIGLNFGVTATF